MNTKFVQINLNNSWLALDLLKQRIAESGIGLALLSEPPRRLTASNRCFHSADKLAAILWNPESTCGIVCSLIESADGFVMVKYGDFCYFLLYLTKSFDLGL